MICAGSGIAPFRGFLQERAIQKQAGRVMGPALLFFGVDAPDVDFLYREEFEEWAAQGVVEVLPAFSAAPVDGIRFVQERVWAERARVAAMFEEGATVYLCGDGQRMAPAVRQVLIDIYREATGVDEDGASDWANEIEHERGRFVADVFA
jgi:cytochrome P450/NADPH-cytochrome P450 reductase